MVTINKLQHIGIPVTNILVSELFYQKLGFTNVMQSAFVLEGDKGVCVMMQNGEVTIELYQLPGKYLQEIGTRNNGHIDHIAFDVKDIETVFEKLKLSGYQIQEDAPVWLPFWKNGCRYFIIVGPDGERLEFNEIL